MKPITFLLFGLIAIVIAHNEEIEQQRLSPDFEITGPYMRNYRWRMPGNQYTGAQIPQSGFNVPIWPSSANPYAGYNTQPIEFNYNLQNLQKSDQNQNLNDNTNIPLEPLPSPPNTEEIPNIPQQTQEQFNPEQLQSIDPFLRQSQFADQYAGFSNPMQYQIPNLQLPNIQIPNLQIPNLQIPNIQLPNIQIPNTQIQFPYQQPQYSGYPNVPLPNLQATSEQPVPPTAPMQPPEISFPMIIAQMPVNLAEPTIVCYYEKTCATLETNFNDCIQCLNFGEDNILVSITNIMGPIAPVSPITPINPVNPVNPINPVNPVNPVNPTTPETPVSPANPASPSRYV